MLLHGLQQSRECAKLAQNNPFICLRIFPQTPQLPVQVQNGWGLSELPRRSRNETEGESNNYGLM
jgi:hypothetical protein